MLTATRLRQVIKYNPKTGVFLWPVTKKKLRGGKRVAGELTNVGYRRIMIDGQRYLAHRLAWLFVYGVWPSGQLDHVNRNRGDNRISNLREATNPQNQANSKHRINNTSGYRGVTFRKDRGHWRADIRVQGRAIYLGSFEHAEVAAIAYYAAAKKYYGKFAVRP